MKPALQGFVPLLLLPLLAGCGTLVSAASERVAVDLRSAVLNHDDPDTVRDGAPAWMLMVDAMAAADPGNAALQVQATHLYASYAGGFVAGDAPRARRLSNRARHYGRTALCAQRREACALLDAPFVEFEAGLERFRPRDNAALYAAAMGELAWIQAHADDWNAIAELPRAQLLLERVVALDHDFERGAPHVFLGVLHALRPPALGGSPDTSRTHFEAALALTDGRDLMMQVLYAEYYARVTYNRELHDRVLNGVLAADVQADGYTLTNVLAQRRARELLASAGDYFFDE